MDFNGTLGNGVELYTCLDERLNGWCLSLWIRRGSAHEPHHGLVHMLEHVTFRCISERMGGKLYATLAKHGLSFDASTYTGYVRFEMSGPPESFDVGVEIMMMVLDAPELSLEGLNLERRRVQAEIREGDSAESANARVWKGTTLARNIAGTATSTNRIGFQMLREEHARWFSRGNFFFCLTGNAPGMPRLKTKIEALNPPLVVPVEERAPVPQAFFHRDADVVVKEDYYPSMRFCFDVDVSRHAEMANMLLLDYLLGDLGALYLALSEDRALVYNLDDCFERFANVGCLSFEFEVEQTHICEAVQAVVDALNAAKTLDEAAFEGAKACFLASSAMSRDDVCGFNNSWGYDNGLRHAGFESPEDMRRAYAAVEVGEIRRMAREIFIPDNLTLCVKGSVKRTDVNALREIVLQLNNAE